MNKLKVFLLVSALMLSTTAFAAETTTQDVYTSTNNKVVAGDVGGLESFKTVIIRKAGDTTDAGIKYIDQKTSGFSAATEFLMKSETEDGEYTASFGDENGNVKTVNFTVGNFTATGGGKTFNLDTDKKMISTDGVMKQSDIDGYENYKINPDKYWKAFFYTINLENISSGEKTIYFVSDDGKTVYGSYNLKIPTNFTGAGELTYAIRVFDIDEEKTGMNLYVGAEEVTQ